MKRTLRRLWHLCERTPPFVKVVFSRRGLIHPDGRTLIWGKFRRFCFSFFPPVVFYLHKKYKMEGGCVSCGASCSLLFQCPHWDSTTRLCTVYEDRPNICRYFPITPADIRDRDLSKKDQKCGFTFKKP